MGGDDSHNNKHPASRKNMLMAPNIYVMIAGVDFYTQCIYQISLFIRENKGVGI